jgi:hypothetical protein
MSARVRNRKNLVLPLACVLGIGASAIAAPPPVVKTFDAPGAGDNGATAQGTLGIGINDFGVIAGQLRDDNDVRHGYLRYPNGKFTVFDHPIAGTGPMQGTRVNDLNALGVVAGSVRDSNNFDQPYVRDPEGTYFTITTGSIPHFAGGNAGGINLTGTMVGNYLSLADDQSVFFRYHGFILSPDHKITLFDPPGSQVTEIANHGIINDEGAVTGDYWTCSKDLSSCSVHGFIRNPNGTYTVIDVPGAGPDGYSGQGTYPQGINDLGEVSGYYADVNSVYHGFVRSASGHITTFDVPTTCTTTAPPADCAFNGTFAANVSILGTVAGTYQGEDGIAHGFWRAANGKITTFDAPQAGYQIVPQAINDWGQITGIAYDANFVTHGLLATPE